MDKDNVVYMYNGIALSLKKKEREKILPLATTQMNLEDIMLS